MLEAELLEELPSFLAPEAETARRQQEPKSELELMKPEAMTMRNAYNLVKKALLPKIKYHWDQGFKQVQAVPSERAPSCLYSSRVLLAAGSSVLSSS